MNLASKTCSTVILLTKLCHKIARLLSARGPSSQDMYPYSLSEVFLRRQFLSTLTLNRRLTRVPRCSSRALRGQTSQTKEASVDEK